MSATEVVIRLLGEVSLMLWGIHMVRSGVLRALGGPLRRWMARGLGGRAGAFAFGAAVTLALQSSTATAMMATSFAGEGAVGLATALALMLGANVGSALIVQAFSFDISLVFPIFIFAGLVAFRRGARSKARDLGRAAIGIGLVLLALYGLHRSQLVFLLRRHQRAVIARHHHHKRVLLLLGGRTHAHGRIYSAARPLSKSGTLEDDAASIGDFVTFIASAANGLASIFASTACLARSKYSRLCTTNSRDFRSSRR